MTFYPNIIIPPHLSVPISSIGLGNFDGIHLGHQVIRNQVDALFSFSPHPQQVLFPRTPCERLTLEHEQTYFEPNLIRLKFNESIATLSPLDFLNKIIKKYINPQKIVVGHDYQFGHKKKGNVALLKEWGDENGIDIVAIEDVMFNGESVRSGRIRDAIKNGQMDEAVTLLGHPYLIEGPVAKGDGRGRKLGYPTANIAVSIHKCMPKPGVYKGYVTVDDKTYKAMIYCGNRPTFKGQSTSLEVHLLDVSMDLYAYHIQVFIESFIRDEIVFSDKNELIHQIKKDIQSAYEN